MLQLKKIYRFYKLWTLRKKANFGKNIIVSKYTEIYLEDGSTREDISIDDNIMLACKLVSQNHGKIRIEEFSSLRHHTQIWAAREIHIGKYVIVSDNVIIADNNSHPINPEDRLKLIKSGWSTNLWKWKFSESKKIIIEDNVWIGKDSKILKGVRIGKNSIVAMGSVVTHDVPANSIVAGNPAKVVRQNIDQIPSIID